MTTKWYIKFKDGARMIVENAKTFSQAIAFGAYERASKGDTSYAELNAESVTKSEEIEINELGLIDV